MSSLDVSKVTQIAAALSAARAQVAMLQEQYDLAMTKARVRFTFSQKDKSYKNCCHPVFVEGADKTRWDEIIEGDLMSVASDIGFSWQDGRVKLVNRTFDKSGQMMKHLGLPLADEMPREIQLKVGEVYEGLVWTQGRVKIEILPATDN